MYNTKDVDNSLVIYEVQIMSLTENKLIIAGVDVATEVNGKVNSSALAKVATSGSYNDLLNLPTITTPVNADWNATSGLALIKNKPTIPTVPTALSKFTNDMGFAKIQSSTTDLTAGSSTLATGTVYLVYE